MGRLFAHVEAFDVQAVRREARAEGISEGRILAFAEIGLSPAEIAQKVGITEEKVKKILKSS